MMEESSSSGSSRRARTLATGSSLPSCMVDGCMADLGQCRDYHRRHKVCELHSKTSIVFVKGQEQRFCQQCSRSRFHSLVEFDDGKRSCRKRLVEHNLRRRKPRRDSVSVDSARLFSSSQGTRYIHFGASRILSGPAISEPLARIAKSEDHTGVYDGHPSSSIGANRRSSAGFINRVVESDSALSLLSSPPVKIQETNMVWPESISGLNYSCIGAETQPVGSVLVLDSGSASLHGQNMFHVMPDGASATGSQPTLSFSWE